MISSPVDIQRRLVPRWRSLALTAKSAELSSPTNAPAGKAKASTTSSLIDRKIRWAEGSTIVAATELVESALVDADPNSAIEAANYLLQSDVSARTEVKQLARSLLDMRDDMPLRTIPGPTTRDVAKRIWRQRTRRNPDNPLGWVELSLLELITGKPRQAERAMRVALALAPNSRHVTRSASRLYLHLGDFERAHDLILRNEATEHDPWLLAAEISVASVAQRNSKLVKQARQTLDIGHFGPEDITELAGSLATLELVGGRQKKARSLFTTSVIAPTGNAMAQAEWASPSFGAELFSPDLPAKVQDADEAQAISLYRDEKFGEVPPACERWSQTEPYSIRPFELGSIAASEYGDYGLALDLAHRGLQIRPDAGRLLNMAAFSLANLDKLDEAEHLLQSIPETEKTSNLVALANRGLIAIKRDQVEVGLSFYANAVQGFLKDGDQRGSIRARVFLAKACAEEGLAIAPKLIEVARKAVGVLQHTNMDKILDAASASYKKQTAGPEAPSLVFTGLSDEQNEALNRSIPMLLVEG